MKKDNKKKIKFKLGNNLTIWVMIVIASFYLVQLLPNSLSTNEVNYNQYRSYLVNGEIYHIQYGQDDKIVFWLKGDESGINKFWTGLDKSEKEDWVKYNVNNIEIKPKEGLGLLDIVFNLAPWVIIILFWFFMMRRMQGGGGQGGIFNFVKSRAKMISPEKSKTSFDDVAGCEEAKIELQEIVQFLKQPKKYLNIGAKIPRGALLLGSPGTGKTLLARAVSGEAQVPFFTISGAEFVEMFVGVGASRVRDLFEQAKKFAPSIIFVDEIDAVGRHRGSGMGGGHDEREQTLNQMLVEMDGFESNEGVIIMAATNRVDVLDPALLRPGRFDRRVTVGRPDVRGRLGILKVHTKKTPLEDDVNLETIAKGTPGFTGADLANLVNEAALIAARENKSKLGNIDFESAKDKVLMGVERKSMMISDEEKRNTAFHESGHVIVGLSLPGNDPVHKVSVIPRGGALGVTVTLPDEDKLSMSKEKANNMIAMLLGGRIAEELIFRDYTSGASNDIERATDIARKMVCNWGMSSSLGPVNFTANPNQPFGYGAGADNSTYSEETAKKIDDEVGSIIRRNYDVAKKILMDRKDILTRMSEALILWETLDSDQIKMLMEGKEVGVPVLKKEGLKGEVARESSNDNSEDDHPGKKTEVITDDGNPTLA